MPALRIGAIVVVILIVVAIAVLWRILGQLVVGFAKMEAEERIDENAPRKTP